MTVTKNNKKEQDRTVLPEDFDPMEMAAFLDGEANTEMVRGLTISPALRAVAAAGLDQSEISDVAAAARLAETGADSVQTIVTGAVARLSSGEAEPRFFAIETASPGVIVEPPLDMLALSGSRTSCVRLEDVPVIAEIPPTGPAGQTGGLGTTALALGSTQAALQ